MTIEELRKENLIILEAISGSRAYGLNTPESDTDIKGVFVLPKYKYYGLDYIEQINDENNDVVFYELGRFMELLSVNNPNIIELLYAPKDCIIHKHQQLEQIEPDQILSQKCKDTFGKYAYTQIKKAKGLKKKIINPFNRERKNILSFCYVNYENGSMPLITYLEIRGWRQEDCGLVAMANMKDVYGLYHSTSIDFNGIVREVENSNEVCLSPIPQGINQEALLYFNRDAYSIYCKNYKEYWEWVDKRNEDRYKITEGHGKNYDAKNMMHVFRLLQMAVEIGNTGTVNVRRPDREFLLEIKAGKYDYDVLIDMAEKKKQEMEEAFSHSKLREKPDKDYINNLTSQLREIFYKEFNHNK